MISKRKISFIMALIFVINCFSTAISAGEIGFGNITENGNTVLKAGNEDKQDIDIHFDVVSDWGSGYSGQITITNNSTETFEDW